VSSGRLAAAAGVSRQAAHHRLRQGVEAGWLVREGRGRAARYRRASERVELVLDPRSRDSEEDRVWARVVAALGGLSALPPNAREITEHALIELVDNAREHARATRVRLWVELDADQARLVVEDDGVGVFESLRRALGLESLRDAATLLARGRATSDARRHRGESLFLLFELADLVEIVANGLSLIVDTRRGDEALAAVDEAVGTRARVVIAVDTERRERDVLSRVLVDHAFARTRASVRLASSGSRFPSRAEARRLLNGLERFAEVVIDFTGVERVGLGFADEVFRVWSSDHPGTHLVPANMRPEIEAAVLHARTPP